MTENVEKGLSKSEVKAPPKQTKVQKVRIRKGLARQNSSVFVVNAALGELTIPFLAGHLIT